MIGILMQFIHHFMSLLHMLIVFVQYDDDGNEEDGFQRVIEWP